jgi:DNA-binding beta-propeller fold protein YncE
MKPIRHIGHALIALAGALLAACGAAPPPGAALPLRNDAIGDVSLIGKPELFDTPFDAAPDPQGKMVYFTATGGEGAGVFRVPFAGGPSEKLATGAPFVEPRGLAVGTDGAHVYVADPQAGGLFALPTAGGAPEAVAGTAGTAPRGVEVARENDADVLFFSGADAGSKQPAVFKIAPAGAGAPTVIAKGAPLVEPVGIAVASDGTLYVADRQAGGNGTGSVFRIAGGKVEQVAGNFRAGSPVVGAALTQDEKALLVSALDTARDSAQVLLIELGSLQQAIVNKVIEANVGSGGIHRAYESGVFAWADSGSPRSPKGGVYAITP